MARSEPIGNKKRNADGTIDTSSLGDGGDEFTSELGGIFGTLPSAGGTRGAPLWPYQLSPDIDQNALTVQDRSSDGVVRGNKRTGPRYFEADTVAPLKWSPEQRAQLQRAMWKMGLYGKDKVRLGGWSAADQAVFGQLLGAANVDGRRWFEQLAYWKRFPPTELLDQMKEKKPTLRVTNPIDIRASAENVSRGLTGRVDRGFVDAAPKAYQRQEVGAQQAAIGDQENGGGGTVTDAASTENFLADKLRREKPLEVDGYAFLGAFDSFLDMIGGR